MLSLVEQLKDILEDILESGPILREIDSLKLHLHIERPGGI